MFISIHGVKLYAYCYSWSEVYAHCYSWSEALCPLLYMVLIHME